MVCSCLLLLRPMTSFLLEVLLTNPPAAFSFLHARPIYHFEPRPRRLLLMYDTGTHEGAAVAILESPLPLTSSSSTLTASSTSEETQKVYGIARMVQVSTEPVLSLLDLSIRFPGYSGARLDSASSSSSSESLPGTGVKADISSNSHSDRYTLYVAKTGDLSNLHTHPYSTGSPLHTLTELHPDGEGYADKVLELTIPLWEVVGRGLVIERTTDFRERMAKASEDNERSDRVKEVLVGKGRLGVLAGVISRSAGGEFAAKVKHD